MHSLKALYPNDFKLLFYKQCWYIVGDEVVKEMQDFFISWHLKPSWNSTFISLLPKIYDPIKVNH